MHAEIVTVGTELLLGQIPDTNGPTIARALAAAGVDVLFETTVGDNETRIAEAIARALERADLVVVTGGLGPTHDDLTREAIARATGRPLERRSDLEEGLRERFRRFGRPMSDANLRQAEQPAGAEPIQNPLGTAPGISLELDGRVLFALPGVPAELQVMLDATVLPALRERAGGVVILSRWVRCIGLAESELSARLGGLVGRLDRERSATLALLASRGEVAIRITAKAGTRAAAEERIEPVVRELRAALGPVVFGIDDESLESVVGGMLRGRRLTLGVAESVTGGLVCSRLVSVPGASELLRAGYVTYSLEAKVRDLGLDPEMLRRHGAVSRETALEMAEGARERAGAELGLSTTGEAGPEPSETHVGRCFVGLAHANGSLARELMLPGDRGRVRTLASQAALDLLRRWLLGGDELALG